MKNRKEFTFQEEDFFYKHKVSYVGDSFRGTVTQTILRETTVFKDRKIVSNHIDKHLRPNL
jgi:allantoinase